MEYTDIDFSPLFRPANDAVQNGTYAIDALNSSSLKELYIQRRDNLGLNDNQVLKLLGLERKTLSAILSNSAKQVGFIPMVKLAHFLDLSVDRVASVYANRLSHDSIGEIQQAKVAAYILDHFDIKRLQDDKFFKRGSTTQELAQRVMSFFGLNNLFNYDKHCVIPAFSRTKRSSNDLMRMFWVNSAMIQFKEICNPNPYDRTKLKDIIPRIRPFTRDVKFGLVKVLRALYNVGVTVIYQPSLTGVQVKGATMCCNDKPCIVLSDLYKRYATVWFVLLHELHHVLFDFEDIKQQVYHLSDDEGDLFLINEERADEFATSYFLNESRQKFVSGYISSPYHIEKFASEWGLHPSIIYSIYLHRYKDEWKFYSKYLIRSDDALQLINTHPFEKETLKSVVDELKEIYI